MKRALLHRDSDLYKLYKKYVLIDSQLCLLDKLWSITMLSSLNQHGNPEKCTRTVDKACGFVNEISKILLDKEIIETNEIKFRELQNLYENLIKKTKQENVK